MAALPDNNPPFFCQDFTYSGGKSSTDATIIFSPTTFEGDTFVSSCAVAMVGPELLPQFLYSQIEARFR